jgi:asparagine synthase (glutamine-hydrolysing)
MCGIAGLLAVRGDAERTRSEVKEMTASLTHRGPDDEGFAAGEGWAIGMRRLAVQDTSQAGHQPMSVDGLTLVFNGEVYNFPALRRELELTGYRFHSGSDTEVVLYALHRWGADALARFNGMFALALVDDQRHTALLARDRFGKKPLFLARLEQGLAFASELKSIMTIAAGQLTLDRDALAQYFRFQYVPTPACIFEQVRKLSPASWLELDLRTATVAKEHVYWSLPAPEPSTAPASAGEVLEAVRDSVKRRLLADVPVGAFLSGGVDSSLVVACMRDAEADVRTFSIGFEDQRYDESGHARAVAEHLQTDHTELRLDPREAIDIVPSLGEVYDEPFADSSAIPTVALARLTRRHVTVALSGDGGDELFGGYTRYRVAPLVGLAARLPRAAALTLRLVPPRGSIGSRARLLSQLAEAGSGVEVYRELVAVWRARELARLMPGVTTLDADSDGAGWTERAGPVERMMRCDARTYLVDDILHKVDRATMAVGLEARNPLLDPAVVSLAFRSAPSAESAPGCKLLLRRALGLQLPEHLFERPKMGFGVPVGEWMRNELRPLLDELVMSRRDAEYDASFARRICQAHLARHLDAAPQVWSLLAFELWRERWRSVGALT